MMSPDSEQSCTSQTCNGPENLAAWPSSMPILNPLQQLLPINSY